MAMFQILASVFYARIFSAIAISRQCIVFISTFIICLQAISFGILGIHAEGAVFVWGIAIVQILGGISQGFITSTVIATLSSFRDNDREKFTGQTFAIGGLGLILSPIFGAFMFQFLKPEMIYISAGCIYFCILILIYPYLKYMDLMNKAETESQFYSPRSNN
jgi:MFS family permease